MSAMDKKITVTLAGQIFTIINQEDLNYVEEIARQTDNKIKLVQRENEHFSITAAAVLSCMDFCDDINRAKKEIIARNKELFDEKEKNAVLTEQIKGLMSEIQSLKMQISQLESGKTEEVSTSESDHVENYSEKSESDEESHGSEVKENKRPGKKEYVPRNNRMRNKKKAEETNEQA